MLRNVLNSVVPWGVFAAVLGVIGMAAALAPRRAEATRPTRDDEIVTQLPARQGALGQRIARLRKEAASAPADLSAALALARAQIEAARVAGDPRPLGRAEAILLPFEDRASAPLLVLRATIHQARHQFELSLADLERAIQLSPEDAQAWLTRASVLTVLGRYAAAAQSCDALLPLTAPFVADVCHASIRGLTGRAAEARTRLSSALLTARAPLERAWVYSVSCELAFWSEDSDLAKQECEQALALDSTDRYTRLLYADVLLSRAEYERAFELSSAAPDDDAMLLRRALAGHALERPEAASAIAVLRSRFEQTRLRGERVHQREEARLLLALAEQPARALALARESFAVQREPWDARLLLEAALAARSPAAAEPALAWLRETSFQAPALTTLATRVRSTP